MKFLKLLGKVPSAFTTQHVAEALSIKPASASRLCQRYVRQGFFISIKRNLYIVKEFYMGMPQRHRLYIGNEIQKPSYISFLTALHHYHIASAPFYLIESVSRHQTLERQVGHNIFQYHRFPQKLFFSFVADRGLKIATPEKALLDSLYLYSLGRYPINLRHINLEHIDYKMLYKLSEKFPRRTQKLLAHLYLRAQKGIKKP